VAIVKAPALSLDASGNVGGICFASWRGVKTARSAWVGTQPNTPSQVVRQGYMTQVSKAWSGTLTASQRQKWGEFARNEEFITRLAMKYNPGGYGVFMKRNLMRLLWGLSILSNPPTVDLPMIADNLLMKFYSVPNAYAWLRYDAGESSIWPLADRVEYWVTPSYTSAGYHPRNPDYRLATIIPNDSQYYFSVGSGLTRWVKARTCRDTGTRGPFFEMSLTN